MTEDEMVGWHHWFNGYEFGWTPGVGDGQGGLECCGSWGCKESDTTSDWTELKALWKKITLDLTKRPRSDESKSEQHAFLLNISIYFKNN